MIKQINEELSIKDSMRQQLPIKVLFSRQFSKEAGKFAEELGQRKVDEGATQSKKTFLGGLHIYNRELLFHSWMYEAAALRQTRGLHRADLSSLSTPGGWRATVSLPPPTTKEAVGDAQGDGEAKELSGNKDMQSLKERSPPALGELNFSDFCFKDFRHFKVQSKILLCKILTCDEWNKYLLWTLAQRGAANPLGRSIAHKNLLRNQFNQVEKKLSRLTEISVFSIPQVHHKGGKDWKCIITLGSHSLSQVNKTAMQSLPGLL